jgi:hypothetical protein
VTHPDRLIWPRLGVRKIDLVHYIEEVGERLLPHFAMRPLSLVRCPDGAEGKCFYQRHPAAGLHLKTVKEKYVDLAPIPGPTTCRPGNASRTLCVALSARNKRLRRLSAPGAAVVGRWVGRGGARAD